ncbi:MAG: 50S ribosomal protein L4 [Bacillota bacterium]|jgi:large subunit ribosomal protein L4|nr:50S ribosomal protein L4 [Bacillota bacterium]HHU43059.1 50S ribosomal protein L4 [Clostridiales bacterium]
MELNVYNTDGKKTGVITVSDEIFNAEYKEALIHQIVVAQLANKRQGTKSALTRAEVRGGGAKPYRQKGTGRARQGSIRSPQWRKGGVVFAPKPRDFSKKINRKMKTAALKSALSQKVRQDEFIVIEDFALPEAKTKFMAAILKNFELKGKTLLILPDNNQTIIRAARNIEGVSITQSDLINVYDLVRNGKCIITKEAVRKLEEVNI